MTGSSCACTAIRKANRAVSRAYDEAMAAHGLTISQFAILRTLAREGAMPLARLAESMVMDRTSLYRTLRPIEAHGWIATGSGQGRARSADLTDAGRAVLAASEPDWEAAQTRFADAMGVENMRMFDRLLASARAAAQAVAA